MKSKLSKGVCERTAHEKPLVCSDIRRALMYMRTFALMRRINKLNSQKFFDS